MKLNILALVLALSGSPNLLVSSTDETCFSDLTPEELALPHDDLVAILVDGSGRERNLRINQKNNERALVSILKSYDDRAAFESDNSGLPMEDFENGYVAPGGAISCGVDILADGTPNACFPEGELTTGLEVVSSAGKTNDIALVGDRFFGLVSSWVASNFFDSATSLRFTTGDTYAMGVDLFDFFGAEDITVSIYGENGLIGTEVATSGGFVGIVADEPIVEVTLGDERNVILLDNVVFGNPDKDGDGISDVDDACPNSDLSATVSFEDCDSGVANSLQANGCTILDIIDVSCGDLTGGAFVSCTSHVTNELKDLGLITGREKGHIQRCAGAMIACKVAGKPP